MERSLKVEFRNIDKVIKDKLNSKAEERYLKMTIQAKEREL